MIVCLCRRISERDIHRAAHDGVDSFDELQSELGVGTACGSCIDCARGSWDEARRCNGPRPAHRSSGPQPMPA
jgi:bacterioferritin-associated ferredoxin